MSKKHWLYPSWMCRALAKSGVIGLRAPGKCLDESETDLTVARARLKSACAKAEEQAARSKIKAMLIVRNLK